MAIFIKFNSRMTPFDIRIDPVYGDDVMEMLDKVIAKGFINPKDFHSARIQYNVTTGAPTDPTNDNHYPLEVYGYNSPRVYIAGVSAGYDGEAPRTLLKILEKFGIKVPAEIERKILHETFDENGNKVQLIREYI